MKFVISIFEVLLKTWRQFNDLSQWNTFVSFAASPVSCFFDCIYIFWYHSCSFSLPWLLFLLKKNAPSTAGYGRFDFTALSRPHYGLDAISSEEVCTCPVRLSHHWFRGLRHGNRPLPQPVGPSWAFGLWTFDLNCRVGPPMSDGNLKLHIHTWCIFYI